MGEVKHTPHLLFFIDLGRQKKEFLSSILCVNFKKIEQ
jgi:hypothetical protein